VWNYIQGQGFAVIYTWRIIMLTERGAKQALLFATTSLLCLGQYFHHVVDAHLPPPSSSPSYPSVDIDLSTGRIDIIVSEGSVLKVVTNDVGLRVKGNWYTVGSGLTLLEPSPPSSSPSWETGVDNMGVFNRAEITWVSAAGPRYQTNVRVYRDSPAVILEQRFPDATWQSTTHDWDQVSNA